MLELEMVQKEAVGEIYKLVDSHVVVIFGI